MIFGQVETDTGQFARLRADVLTAKRRDIAPRGVWQLRDMSPGEGLSHVAALVTGENDGATYCTTSGPLVVLSHGWSGRVRLLERGRAYQLDLYFEKTRLLLIDAANEVAVDVTPLAAVDDGQLRLPALTVARIVEHIVENRVWFAFLEPQPPAALGRFARLRDALAGRKRAPGRLGLMSLLAPALVSGALTPPAAPPRAEAPAEGSEVRALRDELRLVSAAVDGALRRLSVNA